MRTATSWTCFCLVLAIVAASGCRSSAPPKLSATSGKMLMWGGGTGHDFARHYFQGDATTLSTSSGHIVDYTENLSQALPSLPGLDVLIICANQPLADAAVRKGILDFAAAGKGLIVLHPAIYYNWSDWPEFNRSLVGGGTMGQDKPNDFEVTVEVSGHPVMSGVPRSFKIRDELLHFEPAEGAAPIEVLAFGTNPIDGKLYPVVWLVKHPRSKIVCISLGHDGGAHLDLNYQRILKNALKWVSKR